MPLSRYGRIWRGLAAILCGMAVSPSSLAGELPRQVLFEPLLADPRWPHFSAAWHSYDGDGGLDDVGAVSLGDDFSFYQDSAAGGRWGVGLQAGVFAIFDLDADSHDLVNADYWVGVPLSWRRGPWQGVGRVFHQSSHLGDEFLLRARPERVNLSYEGLDFKVSRDLMGPALRLYGGGGVLLHVIPEDLERWSVQGGMQYLGSPILAETLRPVAALDLQATQEADWRIDTSVRVGVMLESPRDRDYRVMLSLEYFRGRNPNGQFYRDAVDFYGVGVHVYF